MITTSLAEEFALLVYGEDGGAQVDGTRLDNGLGGALLLELALAGRVGVADKHVVLNDRTPTGDPLVDDALSRIADDPKNRKPAHWVTKFAKGTRQQVLDRLVAAEVLRQEHGKVLLVFPRTRYPAVAGAEAPVETALRQRLHAAVTGAGAVQPRTAALCALIAAVGMDRKVFADLPRDLVKARLKEIGDGDWAADAVKKSISDIEAAITSGVLAATTVTAVS